MKGQRSKRSAVSRAKTASRNRATKKATSPLSNISASSLSALSRNYSSAPAVSSSSSAAIRHLQSDSRVADGASVHKTRSLAASATAPSRAMGFLASGFSSITSSFSQPSTTFMAKRATSTSTSMPTLRRAPHTKSNRNFSVMMGEQERILVECDPRFVDDEVISLFNARTRKMEPVIVAVPEPSYEFIYSSPVDLHTFDVIPVAKECIDIENPIYESQGK